MISRDSLKGITSVIAVGLAIFQIYFTAGFGIIDSQLLRTIHLGIVLALVFLYFPPKKLQEGEREHPGWLALDLVLICGAFATAYFLASDIDYYMERIRYVDPVSDAETVCATAAVLLVLEATRRVAGLPLVIVASAFLAYGLGGQYLPGILRHDGVTYKMLCEQLYLVTEGLYGIPLAVSSTDRTVGTILGSDITRLHGNTLPDGTFTVKCTGGGGQSFGAFLPRGLTLELEGDANDYLGKGLSGGRIIVYPPKSSAFVPENNILVGNVALYGATGGVVFLNGVAGERFCVRNSGADAVVEGVGDHGCEYMTGGRVVVLGPTGKNFAAGMSGGVAYVLDEDHDLYLRLNKELVSMGPVTDPQETDQLRALIQAHADATGSPKARRILADFDDWLPKFKKILPDDYDRMLRSIAQFEARGMDRAQAEVEAFCAATGRKGV